MACRYRNCHFDNAAGTDGVINDFGIFIYLYVLDNRRGEGGLGIVRKPGKPDNERSETLLRLGRSYNIDGPRVEKHELHEFSGGEQITGSRLTTKQHVWTWGLTVASHLQARFFSFSSKVIGR